MILNFLKYFFLFLYIYPFIVYPAILVFLNLIIKRKDFKNNIRDEKDITVLISAYNEEEYISKCIDSIINSDYPFNKINILIGSDGSDDNTNKILELYSLKYENIKFTAFKRGGKNNVINQLIKNDLNNYVLFIDADCVVEKNTISNTLNEIMNSNFDMLLIPVKKVNKDENLGQKGESIYQKYEESIRRNEAKIHSTINALGIYMIKKSFISKIGNNRFCDDLFMALNVIKKKGRVGVSNSNVLETRETSIGIELKRRIRLTGGGLSTIFNFIELLNPFQNFWASFFIWSHKIIRYFSPFALIIFLFLTLITLNEYQISYIMPIFVFILAIIIISILLDKFNVMNPFKILSFFVLMNLGIFIGVIKSLTKNEFSIWSNTNK